MSAPVRRMPGAVWLPPALVALAACLYHLSTPVMWHDELATISIVSRPVGGIRDTLQNVDAVHGAYYLLLHGWIHLFGDSPAALRLPSVLAMTGAVVCTSLVARRLFDSRAGLVSGLLLALVPALARYGQEVRSYGFVVFTAALALLLLLRALERPNVLRWACYAVALLLSGYFNLVSLSYLAPHALWVLWVWRRDGGRGRPLGFLGALLVLGAGLLPLLRLGSSQAKRQISWVPRPTVRGLLTIWPQILCSTALAVALAAIVLLLAWRVRKRAELVFALLLVLIPFAVIWTVSHGSVSYFLSKYEFFLLPAIAVLAGSALATLRLRFALPVVLALAVLVIPDQRTLHGPLSHAEYLYPEKLWFTPLDYRSAAGIVAAGYRQGDGIVYGYGTAQWWEIQTGIPYYLPAQDQPREVFAGVSAAERDDLWGVPCPHPSACLGDEPRLWLVAHGDVTDAFRSVPAGQAKVLRQHYRVTSRQAVSGLTVFLLVRTA